MIVIAVYILFGESNSGVYTVWRYIIEVYILFGDSYRGVYTV